MLSVAHWLGLDDSHLSHIDDNHKLLPEVAQAFKQMQQAALKDGIDLQIVSSYRNFKRQLSIWNQKWQGQRAIYSLDGELLDPLKLTEEQKLHAILTWSALPGASRHHWGTDLDVFDKTAVERAQHQFELVASEYQDASGPCYQLARWLAKHAASYGFYRPYNQYQGGVAAEPWHLSYQPIAEQIIQQLSLEDLNEQLANSDLLGKASVLKQLPALFTRYTLNVGTEENRL